MLPVYAYLLNVLITAVTAGVVFAVWLASRKRIAAETIGQAQERAARLIKDAELEDRA